MRLSGSAAALSGPDIPGTNGLTLGALLSMVPMSAMVGSGIARQRWSRNSARWVDGVSPLLLTYVDCQSVLDTSIGTAMVAAHLNQSSIFECQDTVGVSSLIRSAADENNCYTEPGGRSQKLVCIDWRVRDGSSTFWRCYTCYALQSVVVGLGWAYGSWVSGLTLSFMVLQSTLQTILMMRLDRLWKTLLTKKEDPMAFFLAPNWNSDESYLVVGPRSLLSTVIGDRRKFDRETLFLAKAITTVGAITVGLCVMLAATADLPGILGFIALVTISIIGSHPRFAKDVKPLTCKLTFARRRSAYTLAYIMHGSPEQPGWWNGAFPSTDRQAAWERNVRAWINGEKLEILEIDDMGDLFSVQNALLALDKAGFKAVHPEVEVGVTRARNADLGFLRDIHSKRTALECLEKNCFCRKEQGLVELADKKKGQADPLSEIV
ncbi:hypothetical protein BGZ46_002280 [Entomortierella lignicola]|nr:hypothetical protein BGZ46_002280 [Entomortierella lignicola]